MKIICKGSNFAPKFFVNKAHYYQALQIIMKGFRRQLLRSTLDQACQRVTPRQWSYYSAASTVAPIIRNQEPSLLYSLIANNALSNSRRFNRPSLYDTSRKKVGRQSIHNQLIDLYKTLNEDWFECGASKDSLRILFKKTFSCILLLKMTRPLISFLLLY
jgi:hypothetical protein